MAFKRKISLPATRQAFILILLLAAFLRLYQLDKFPVSLNWDEISHSYNAYSILKTGKDQWGTKMPIFNFRAYGDYPTTLNMYLTIPWVKFLGLNAWSTRLPSAICGIVIVIFAYLITESLLKNKLISLSVMFLAAISPWTLFT
ncbi:MAG TPA: phospholipid carrier-dependent glycosyltransferase, partial [Candidatus Woesebacteria bacterium]|nr:phospholipid carrier-dependent glycosyltransferase [Candidatus Woesebacteria bacterium]